MCIIIIIRVFQIITVLSIITSSGDRVTWGKHIHEMSMESLWGQLVPGDFHAWRLFPLRLEVYHHSEFSFEKWFCIILVTHLVFLGIQKLLSISFVISLLLGFTVCNYILLLVHSLLLSSELISKSYTESHVLFSMPLKCLVYPLSGF